MPSFQYNPNNGVAESFDYDEDTGTAYVKKQQDVSPLLDRLHEIRATGGSDEKLRQDDYFCLYAQIPPTVELALKQRGYDLMSNDQAHLRKVLQIINTEYPNLKATYKTHA
jgi:thermostable 8-oxoguanine DNA glycosylase